MLKQLALKVSIYLVIALTLSAAFGYLVHWLFPG